MLAQEMPQHNQYLLDIVLSSPSIIIFYAPLYAQSEILGMECFHESERDIVYLFNDLTTNFFAINDFAPPGEKLVIIVPSAIAQGFFSDARRR